jgi:hypothetical protein
MRQRSHAVLENGVRASPSTSPLSQLISRCLITSHVLLKLRCFHIVPHGPCWARVQSVFSAIRRSNSGDRLSIRPLSIRPLPNASKQCSRYLAGPAPFDQCPLLFTSTSQRPTNLLTFVPSGFPLLHSSSVPKDDSPAPSQASSPSSSPVSSPGSSRAPSATSSPASSAAPSPVSSPSSSVASSAAFSPVRNILPIKWVTRVSWMPHVLTLSPSHEESQAKLKS